MSSRKMSNTNRGIYKQEYSFGTEAFKYNNTYVNDKTNKNGHRQYYDEYGRNTRYNYYGNNALNEQQYVSTDRPYWIDEPLKRRTEETKRQSVGASDILFKFKMTALGLVIFIASFAYVGITSQFHMKQNELKNITKEILNVQSEKNSISAAISQELNIQHVREIAETELDMVDPLPHQIVYIEVNKESMTIYGRD